MSKYKELGKYQQFNARAYHWFECGECQFVGLGLKHNIAEGRVGCDCRVVHVTGVKSYPEHHVWHSMLDRCRRPGNSHYSHYGARGITVCDRWQDFQLFWEDMGPRPTAKHTLDRIDVNLGYSRGNCRWATHLEQARNKTNNLWVAHNGETKLLLDWVEILGEPYDRLKRRFYRTGRLTRV